MNFSVRRFAVVTVAGIAVATASGAAQKGVGSMTLPVGADAAIYSLAEYGDGALLSWLESSPAGRALRFSAYDGRRWSRPGTIAEGADLFSNWADHPSIAALGDGTLVAQWPVVNPGTAPPGSYNNSIRIAVSRDRGATWKVVFADGRDNIHSYSGFVSLLPGAADFSAVYLTPPRPVSHDPSDHTMTLSYAAVDRQGNTTGPVLIDGDTCSCCPTAFAHTSAGPIAAYRDHEAGEIRDISIVRLIDGTWTKPRPVHRDGWNINGCPTNGPELVADGTRVVAAWFTGAGNVPRMKVAFSSDAGASFSAPVIVDAGRPVGRGALAMLADGSVAVAWLESLEGGTGELRLRRIGPDGQPGTAITVGPASPGRTTGMPQMIRTGHSLLLVWWAERLIAATVPLSLL